MVGSRRVKFGEHWLLGGAFLVCLFDVETSDEQSRSWVVIDVASHPERPEVLLQSFSTDQGSMPCLQRRGRAVEPGFFGSQSSGRQEGHEMKPSEPASIRPA